MKPVVDADGRSGFIISPDGYVITNHHVVDGASQIRVKLNDKREFDAKLVGSDKLSDIALLKIDAANLPTVTIGDAGSLKVGQRVFAIRRTCRTGAHRHQGHRQRAGPQPAE